MQEDLAREKFARANNPAQRLAREYPAVRAELDTPLDERMASQGFAPNEVEEKTVEEEVVVVSLPVGRFI